METKTMCFYRTLLAVFLFVVFPAPNAEAVVIKEGNNTYFVDRTGERWDITQAVSIGYDPDKFEFGIGRDAFEPLDGTHLKSGSKKYSSGMRVIGVAGDGDAHAYSVQKLSNHETANTFLGSKAIVAGY